MHVDHAEPCVQASSLADLQSFLLHLPFRRGACVAPWSRIETGLGRCHRTPLLHANVGLPSADWLIPGLSKCTSTQHQYPSKAMSWWNHVKDQLNTLLVHLTLCCSSWCGPMQPRYWHIGRLDMSPSNTWINSWGQTFGLSITGHLSPPVCFLTNQVNQWRIACQAEGSYCIC